MKAEGKKVDFWSWTNKRQKSRGVVGGHARPWAKREQLINKEFGELLRSLMKSVPSDNITGRMTVKELGIALGYSQPHVSMMLGGRVNVTMTLIWDVAEVFNLSPVDLITKVDEGIAKFEERTDGAQY